MSDKTETETAALKAAAQTQTSVENAPLPAGKGVNTPKYKAGDVFFTPSYLLAQAFAFFIYLLGLKWTLFGLQFIPFVFNWFLYFCIVLFWLYYNYMWLRIALSFPTTMLCVSKTYEALGIKMSFWKLFYLSLCKVNKLRKEDIRIKRECEFIKMLAASFRKPAIVVNFKRGESKELSTAIFIHTKRKVIAMYKAVMPYFAPTFIVIVILTPILVFLASYNYRFLTEALGQPLLKGFRFYLLILPFKLAWVFGVLSILATNILSPLITVPCIKLFAQYVKENNLQLNLSKKHRFPVEGLISMVMLLASLIFYISVLKNILL